MKPAAGSGGSSASGGTASDDTLPPTQKSAQSASDGSDEPTEKLQRGNLRQGANPHDPPTRRIQLPVPGSEDQRDRSGGNGMTKVDADSRSR
jgi:hypothetical protein